MSERREHDERESGVREKDKKPFADRPLSLGCPSFPVLFLLLEPFCLLSQGERGRDESCGSVFRQKLGSCGNIQRALHWSSKTTAAFEPPLSCAALMLPNTARALRSAHCPARIRAAARELSLGHANLNRLIRRLCP
jgi:hypothetical protein